MYTVKDVLPALKQVLHTCDGRKGGNNIIDNSLLIGLWHDILVKCVVGKHCAQW